LAQAPRSAAVIATGYAAIAAQLNADGLTTGYGGSWTQDGVCKALGPPSG